MYECVSKSFLIGSKVLVHFLLSKDETLQADTDNRMLEVEILVKSYCTETVGFSKMNTRRGSYCHL